ncbi:uncharacterized protein DUF4393 [Panacagrimonas perspica]|uniref:Uncharacterized protein DUF4393 n=1 Tax=Panacagrimonas perspica TaxID=381431 RepID=A0A4R7P491_9GAMM|nr:Abi-alpha family protein [Panacagrimonas perspica]TDU28458.1 uncharacterized protein DUF4393 [Panacagrimonas perspica]
MSKHEADQTPADADGPAEGPGSFIGFVASGAWKLATGAPRRAMDLAQKGLSEAEKLALTTLRKRMDAVADDEAPHDEDDAPQPPSRPAAATPSGMAAASGRLTAAAAMARLMEESLEQTAEQALERLALRTVRQLVPDEARILAALVDGHSAALVHVGAGPLVGPASQRWLENLSPVGRECGVRLLDQIPTYLANLRNLGLLESGDEDKALHLKYQLIEADTLVRKTCGEIEKAGLRVKFFRRTIRISEAGKAFWNACEGVGNQSW